VSQYRRGNEGSGCGVLIVALILIFFGPAILEFVLFILFMVMVGVLSFISSVWHTLFGAF
jgi:hypothetical protein